MFTGRVDQLSTVTPPLAPRGRSVTRSSAQSEAGPDHSVRRRRVSLGRSQLLIGSSVRRNGVRRRRTGFGRVSGPGDRKLRRSRRLERACSPRMNLCPFQRSPQES
ncbi:unnamed protein product [Rangifer tarandus platyrhynchus]|uniref:Uncharacterized protein n=1 Tax=Rangifer tarandus platyrhynchus TaxID=3082113 RepID=A0ABN8YLD4_RANTA|nr:unnamed protein product [Rangifer tarandus platyrhynchus]